MDVKFINPFLFGAEAVMKKMAFIEPNAGKPYVKKTDTAGGDVSGIIGITGEAVGSLAISFSEACICGIVNSMLGESYTEVNKDVFDAVGEITNMVSGVARTHMEKDGIIVHAAIPTVVYGKGHLVRHVLGTPSIVIPFETEKGNFVVDVCVKSNVKQKQPPQPIVKTLATEGTETVAGDTIAAAEETMVSAQQIDDPVERLQIMRKVLAEVIKKRDGLMKLLRDNPFMEMQKRQQLNKLLPAYDAKIKRMKLDIAAQEMLSSIK
ncbi:MAG: chemotaxis protein CheX [Deltaproteobacteria bacterium]|nr:chemotaxis protein CheX [Deltaproteobacteria bacterium]